MANFVETATLRLNDQSTKNIRKINAELTKLNNTAKKLKTTLAGLDLSKGLRVGQSARSVTTLTRRLSDLQKQLGQVQRAAGRGININAKANMSGLNGMVSSANRLQGSLRGANRELSMMQRFWNRSGRAMNYAFGGTMYSAAHRTAAVAGQAPITMDTARARARQAGFGEETAVMMEEVSRELSRKYKGVSAADILMNSVEASGSTDNLDEVRQNMEMIAKYAVIYGGALGDAALGAEQARQAWKAVQIHGDAGDPQSAAKIMDAVARGFIATGYDVNAAEAVRALQQSGSLKYGMSEKALLEMILSRDEGGRMSSAEYRMAFAELIRGNLSDEKMGLQIQTGLRDANGRSLVGDQFAASPLDFTQNTIIPILKRLNVNLDNMVAVQDSLENELGFNSEAARLLTGNVTQLTSRLKEREKALRAIPEYTLTNPTISQQATEVRAQFQNVSERALGVFLPVASVALEQLSTSLANIAEGSLNPYDYATAAATAVPVAIGAALDGMTDPQTRPLATAGLALSGSAAALTTAAGALTAAAGANAVGGGIGGFATGAAGGGLLAWLTRVGKYGRFGRGLKMGGGIGLGLGALGVAERVLNGESFTDALQDAAPGVAGSIAGGIVGSLVGPGGTLIGSLIGGAIADAVWGRTEKNIPKDTAHSLTQQQHADTYFGNRTAMRPEDVMLHTQRTFLEREIASYQKLIDGGQVLDEFNAEGFAKATAELKELMRVINQPRATDGTLMPTPSPGVPHPLPTPRPAYEPNIPVPTPRDAIVAEMGSVTAVINSFGNSVDMLVGIDFKDDFSGGAEVLRHGIASGADAVAAAIRSALSTPITVRAIPVPSAAPANTGATGAGG